MDSFPARTPGNRKLEQKGPDPTNPRPVRQEGRPRCGPTPEIPFAMVSLLPSCREDNFSRMAEYVDFDLVDEHGSHAATAELVIERDELDRDEVSDPVRVRVNLEAFKGDSAGEYVVEGEFEASSKLICSRCLEAFSFAEGSEFAVRYVPRTSVPDGVEEDLEIDHGGLDIGYYDERRLPVTEVVAEQVQLAIPMKALCKGDCRGLCPECGTDLNEGNCSCERESIDDRWRGLEEIRKNLKENE